MDQGRWNRLSHNWTTYIYSFWSGFNRNFFIFLTWLWGKHDTCLYAWSLLGGSVVSRSSGCWILALNKWGTHAALLSDLMTSSPYSWPCFVDIHLFLWHSRLSYYLGMILGNDKSHLAEIWSVINNTPYTCIWCVRRIGCLSFTIHVLIFFDSLIVYKCVPAHLHIFKSVVFILRAVIFDIVYYRWYICRIRIKFPDKIL